MNRVIITFLLLIGIIASSCTTSKSIASEYADIRGTIKHVTKQIAGTFTR